jgi:hypothetical protein
MIMAADATKEIQFEIGHVLFIDIVGYSKLLINEQSEQIQTLREPDRAIAALEKTLSIPCNAGLATGMPLTPALLRLDPMFDPLRNDPRFQKLCEDKPK